MRNRLRVWVLETGPLVILLAGFALIVAGIVCLFLSGIVAGRGSWWQGTLDAFGVGFVVGGLVDLVAVSLLNWAEKVRHDKQRVDVDGRLAQRYSTEHQSRMRLIPVTPTRASGTLGYSRP
jgi:hypothetical protein